MDEEKNIHERMLKQIDDKYDKSIGSFIYDSTKPVAIELEIKNSDIKEMQNKLDIENLSGSEVDRFIYPRTGQTRKYATKAITTVIITGQQGANIKKGDMVSADGLNFISLENSTIGESGQMVAIVMCEKAGSIGNLPANSINQFPITIRGLVNVYNPDPIRSGYDQETDRDFKNRYYEKYQKPAKSGNKYHYKEWAKEVIGVGGAKIIPRFNGALTMKVVIVDTEKRGASEELIRVVDKHIREEMPFGVEELLVASANQLEINISVNLTIHENYELDTVKENIKIKLDEYFKGIAFESTIISYAQVGGIILSSDGVVDYSELKLNGKAANIQIDEEEVAVMGEVY